MRNLCVALLLLLGLTACGGGGVPGEDPGPPAEKGPTTTPPSDEASPPKKTPEQLEAEGKAAREKKIAELAAKVRDASLEPLDRWGALMNLKNLKPFPPEAIECAVELLRESTGENPPKGPELGGAALNLLLEAGPDFAEARSGAILEALSGAKKAGLLQANLIAAVADNVPAEKGLPLLVEGLRDEMNHNVARDGLVRFGKAAVPALLEAVKAFESGMPRSQAIAALGMIHEEADSVVPVLIEMLEKGGRHELGPAAEALAEFGVKAKTALPALRQVAENGMFGAREAKAAIEKIGE